MEIQNEKHVSVLNVPLEIPISEIEKQVNLKINGLIYEDNSYEDGNDNLKAKVWKISPIRVVAIDSSFLFEVPLKIWVSAGYKVSPLGITMSGYKDTEFSIKVRLISKIGVKPDWHISSQTLVEGYDWITEPSVSVAGFKIPIKAMVSRMLNHNFDKIATALDDQIGTNIELKRYASVAWRLAQNPFLLSKEFNTWLTVTPTDIMMTPLAASNGIMRSVIGIRAYTQTITSLEKPVSTTRRNFPLLQIKNAAQDDFKVALISKIGYPEAGKLANDKFKGEKFSFLGGKYQIEVTSVEMYGQNDKMVIKAGLKGGVNGFVFLKGRPYYDPVSQNLMFKDLDYDLDTKNSLIKTANWLLQGQFGKMMQKKMVFPMGDQINDAKTTIQSVLKEYKVMEGVSIKGNIKEISPDRVYLTPDHIYSVVFVEGHINLQVTGLSRL